MFGSHFYNQHVRKLVAVFGTLFNDIQVRKTDNNGNVLEESKVPLAYGPKQKFLARIQEQANLEGSKVAIKLPRMSFEISGLSYDVNAKLNKQNKRIKNNPSDPDLRDMKHTYAPYTVNMTLSIMAKNQDEGLQIVEQILPYFQPEYSVTVIEDADLDIKTDIPIVLNSVTLSEEYEGDMLTRNAIIYTLEFTTRIRFYGPKRTKGIIRETITDFNDIDTAALIEKQTITTDPATAASDQTYTYVETYDFFED
jgi:hypothetical protein